MGDGADGQDQLQTFYCPFQAIATVEEEEGRGWGGGGRLLFGSFIQLIFVKIRSSKTSSILLLPIVWYCNNMEKMEGKFISFELPIKEK